MGAPFVWFDLTMADGQQVAGLYQGLFGWEAGPGPGGYQDWLLDGGQPWAGPWQEMRCRPGAGFPTCRWTTSTPR